MTDIGCGHGWVYRAPGGARAPCGGPEVCAECYADLARFAASQPPMTPEQRELRDQLQASFDRMRREEW